MFFYILGRYLYAEASNNEEKTAVLTTRTLKSSTPYCLRFFLNMNGRDMGEFDVELLQNGQSKNVYTKKGNQGKAWREGRVELPANQEYRVGCFQRIPIWYTVLFKTFI